MHLKLKILSVVKMPIVFLVVKSCSLVGSYQRFERTYQLHLQESSIQLLYLIKYTIAISSYFVKHISHRQIF